MYIHLDKYDAGGGDSASIVHRSIGERKKRIRYDGSYSQSIVLLDADRRQVDQQTGRAPRNVPTDLTTVWLQPNLEGLYVRLHRGHEAREVQAVEAVSELQRLWRNYRKGVSAVELNARFGIDDLRRAARRDDQLKLLLEVLSLT